MAEAVLEFALENLSSLIQNEVGLFLGFNEEMERLKSILTTIKATLEDAEERQFTQRAIKDWLQKLKDAAHVLDDILDECATEAKEFEYRGLRCGQADKVQSSCLSYFHPKRAVFRHKIAHKMKSISKRLDEIAEERSRYHLREMVTENRNKVPDWRQTMSTIPDFPIRGRDEERDKIVDILVGDASNSEHLLVYPIVGMGGQGKTTLAKLIFNHEKVVNHFEPRIWICVSEDFSLKRMLKAIIKSAGHACEDDDPEPLQRRLRELLQRKRYFLVLDDVWSEDQGNWDSLKSVLACGEKGTSILVTTRLTTVASIMGTMPPHQLSMLSENDCWEVFKQRAFAPNEEERAELVIIGKEIVKKCSGVPLAAEALGSRLLREREERAWRYVRDSELWSLKEADNPVMAALRLSYLNLPVKLRICFAYCALFPKDMEISKQDLIELWMANGFISSNGIVEVEVEDVGDQVWNELYWRSFFQDTKQDELGKITSFKMHDLVHDLAQSVAKEVCCIEDDNVVTCLSERIRHISIYSHMSFDQLDSLKLHEVKSLKTCKMPYYATDNRASSHLLKCYSLRVLDMERLQNLSSSIGHLKHLRYLNLSGGRFKTLPKSLCRLWNLQILKLDYCDNLQKLPSNLKCLKALRHLSLRECSSLSSMPPNIGELTSLRTLSIYIVGREEGFRLSELGNLQLEGELHIENLERVRSAMDAKEANLESKQLREFRLSWDINEESQLQENVEQILESLQPRSQQLTSLGVIGYTGVRFPRWMDGPSLKELEFLELYDCKSCLQLPLLGKLPSLKRLRISRMDHVKYLDDESYDGGAAGCFIALECLTLQYLPNLIRLSREERDNMFPRLYEMKIEKCPKLALPCLPSLKDLEIWYECNQDLLSSIPKQCSLELLRFRENEDLTSFPDGMLRDLDSLKTLYILWLTKLKVLPTESINLTAIQELSINCCNSLEPLTEQMLQGLHSLKILRIWSYPKFSLSAGFQYLTSLEQLGIFDIPKVEGLPESLQHLTALQSLSLDLLPNLRSLPDWLGNLGLLNSLRISSCPKLMCLPMTIQHLSSLETLSIYNCPELSKRCEKEEGEDWPKIAHVQHVFLDEDFTPRPRRKIQRLLQKAGSCY